MGFSDYLKEGFQFNIKNTHSGSWFCDIARLKWVDHEGIWSDIYLEDHGDRFYSSMEEALSRTIENLNSDGFMEFER